MYSEIKRIHLHRIYQLIKIDRYYRFNVEISNFSLDHFMFVVYFKIYSKYLNYTFPLHFSNNL